MARTFTLLDFYRILYRIVRSWPASSVGGVDAPCKRLQTFAVIQRESDLNSDSLGKSPEYLDKNLFYSRRWEQAGHNPSALSIDLPALYIWPNTTSDDKLRDKTLSIQFSVGIAMNDPSITNKEDGPCRRVSYEEQQQNMINFWLNLMAELDDVVLADFIVTGQQGGGFNQGYSLGFNAAAIPGSPTDNVAYNDNWVSRSYLKRMATAGLIEPDYSENDSLSNYLVGSQGVQGVFVNGVYTMAPMMLLQNFRVQFPHCTNRPEFSYTPIHETEKIKDQ